MVNSETDQISGPSRVLYILNFAILDKRREYKIFWADWQKAVPELNTL
jgi:hypothetical protein